MLNSYQVMHHGLAMPDTEMKCGCKIVTTGEKFVKSIGTPTSAKFSFATSDSRELQTLCDKCSS
jgi:hypothetical protein